MLVYLPDDVKNCDLLKRVADRCLQCAEEQPCVAGCPQHLDLAMALDCLRRVIFIEEDERSGRLAVLPSPLQDALKLKEEAERCRDCPEPTPAMAACPEGIPICDAMRIVGRAIVAGLPSQVELI
ncbi:MAG: hypothetical protein RML36_08710 [Anaerolineae bacterium]|nr:hypothetical protein [Anaerolineae bacterium]MDW8099546.1 hypothetical protein [Anaerolineae bacterium]